MNKNYLVAGVITVVFFSTTAAVSGMPAPDVKPASDVAWLVIGIRPQNMRIEVKELRVKDGIVEGYHPFPLDMTMPIDGFIVFKAHPGITYGIVAASAMANNRFFGIRYKACHEMATFTAEGGKVVYFTTFNYYSSTGTEYPSQNIIETSYKGVNYTQDLEGAQAFLKLHYPKLDGELEQGNRPILPITHNSCF